MFESPLFISLPASCYCLSFFVLCLLVDIVCVCNPLVPPLRSTERAAPSRERSSKISDAGSIEDMSTAGQIDNSKGDIEHVEGEILTAVRKMTNYAVVFFA
jgi:hypothetical protein